MKINKKILSLPPYISTSWDKVTSLHVDQNKGDFILNILLENGSKVEIPNLDKQILEHIFTAHRESMETSPASQANPQNKGPLEFAFPFKGGLDTIEGMGNVMHHNPQQANSPDLPPDLIKKIASVAKAVGVDDQTLAPKPEPHCNCPHCQIARAIQKSMQEEDSSVIEEEVTEEDLRFRNWDIKQTSSQLYIVTNPLNSDEEYRVFLGDPIGCNCGEKNCEHIKAVLQS